MLVPHQRYLMHLLAQGLTPMEVSERCRQLGLRVLSVQELSEVAEDAGFPPPFEIPAKLGAGDVRAFRWIRDRGMLPFWFPDATTRAAFNLMRTPTVRHSIEVLLISGIFKKRNAYLEVRDNLATRYPSGLVPDVETIGRFCQLFFALGDMDYIRIEEHKLTYEDEVQNALKPTEMGDLSDVYAYLGLVQNMSEPEILQRIVRLNLRQIALAEGSGVLLTGSLQAGLASMQKLVVESMDRLGEYRERHTPKTDVVQRAQSWKLETPKLRRVRSIEDILATENDGAYIDVEDSGSPEASPLALATD